MPGAVKWRDRRGGKRNAKHDRDQPHRGRRSSFDLTHRLSRDGALAVEGFETRVWAARDPARPGRFKAKPIPPELLARLTPA
jgi:hypothetical protein